MKCPHCGMNIRDNITDCGYCGGKIVQESEKSTTGAGRPNISGGIAGQKGAETKSIKPGDEEPEEGEEEGGGLSVYLQKGEHVLIGSLNITVKKFFFHAYLTDQRIFLIDTQEKKVKVTAKDIPRESIVGSSIEFSENSDPVLVLSIRSPDDEIKTMKLVFVQNGMERSDEIDEWIALLHEEDKPKKSPAPQEEERPSRPEEPVYAEPEKTEEKQDLKPRRMPAKEHEKQPPVKRHFAVHAAEEQAPPVQEPSRPLRRAQIREVADQEPDRGTTPVRTADNQTVHRREVQSAMKVAMKSAMQPLKHSSLQSTRRPVIEPVSSVQPEPAPEEIKKGPRRSVVQEKPERIPVREEVADIPQFCHNCGKKLPVAANFCPNCGTKISQHHTLPQSRAPESHAEKKAAHHPAPSHEKRTTPHKEEIDEEEKEDETPVPVKPPVRKLPKGSEMTILHKFLRR
jgi:hypothetical protein